MVPPLNWMPGIYVTFTVGGVKMGNTMKVSALLLPDIPRERSQNIFPLIECSACLTHNEASKDPTS